MTITSTCTSFAGNHDGLGDAPVQYQSHSPMCCAQCFNLSHCMPQSAKYLLSFAPETTSIQAIGSKPMHITCWRFWWHSDAPVQYQAHQHMRRAQSFNLSHWTLQLVEYLLRIALATARVPYKLLIANKCISLACNVDGHGNAPVQYQAHGHMCHAQRFN